VTEPALAVQLGTWASSLRLDDVPSRVASLATSQVLSQLAAIRAGLAHPLGRRLLAAYGPPLQADTGRSAAVLAALGSWLNLDDTAYAGHLGPSTVSVPVAYAHAEGRSGAALLAAVIAADECAARITAAATLGPLRGQSALHTHLAGAVAGRLHVQAAPAQRWIDALGLSFSTPSWPAMHGFLGSDAKVLHAFVPVRAAMDACDAAAAGLRGAPDILEHPDGFLARFATVPLPAEVIAGLGRRWYTDTLSFKVRPGGPGIDAAVDCCLDLHRQLRAAGVSIDQDVAAIDIDASIYTLFAAGRAEQYLDGAATPISALLLTTPYAVASTLLTGTLTVADFAEPALGEQRRWALAERVRLTEDPELTAQLFAATAPFGEAVRHAGAVAAGWLGAFGTSSLARFAIDPAQPAETFESATKRTPARVTVRLRDGRTFCSQRDIPIGAAGADSRLRHRELVRTKFLDQGGSTAVADALGELELCPAGELARLLELAIS